jgi:hypothetical protein
MLIHKDALKIHAVASTDITRPQFQGVHVLPDGSCEATNGYILLRVKRQTASAFDYPNPSKDWKPPTIPAEGFTIPTDSAKEALRMPPTKAVLPILNDAVLVESVTEGKATLSATNLDAWVRLECKTLDGGNNGYGFPKCDAVMPDPDKAVFTIGVNPLVLAKALTTLAEAMGAKKAGICPDVVMRFYAPLAGIRLDCLTYDGQASGVVMPVKTLTKEECAKTGEATAGSGYFSATWGVK